jgi:hypothetical protein
MRRYYWGGGRKVGLNEWTGWFISDDGKNLLNYLYDGTYTHILCANHDEPSPNSNHLHIKTRNGLVSPIKGPFILCSAKVSGMRLVNRRRLIEEINRSTGLNLSWR